MLLRSTMSARTAAAADRLDAGKVRLRGGAGNQRDLDEAQPDDREDRVNSARRHQHPGAAGFERALASVSVTIGAQGGGLKCRGRHGFSSARWIDSMVSARSPPPGRKARRARARPTPV